MLSEARREGDLRTDIEPLRISIKNIYYIHYGLSESTEPFPYNQYKLAEWQQFTMSHDQ